jgi:hypothetical protein
LRLVVRPESTTTSSSTQVPPALMMSVLNDGNEVSVAPLTMPASTSTHGPWQIDAIGFLALANPAVNETALGSARRKSPLATPPGMSSPSYSSTLTSSSVLSTFSLSPWSRWSKPWISPASSETSSVCAPASSSALRGSVSSTCSTPSVARIAIFLP